MPPVSPLQLFKSLSDETRLSLVLLLREKGELCVCELTSVLKETQPKISRHLALLRENGLLTDRREDVYKRQVPATSGHQPSYRRARPPHLRSQTAAVSETSPTD